jgi:hypothetical protein
MKNVLMILPSSATSPTSPARLPKRRRHTMLHTRRCLLAALILTAMTLSALPHAAAEVPLLSSEQLQSQATHIVVGKILAIYSREVANTTGRVVTHYLLEIEAKAVEKGADLRPGDLVYARCWRLTAHGSDGPVPGASGHSLRDEGENVRVHLIRGDDSGVWRKDKGLSVLLPNGIVSLAEEGDE